jgi:hypothetical protein
MTTLRNLFADAAPERLSAIEQALTVDETTHTPWYIQVLIVIGAWLASFFLLFFVFCLVGQSLLQDEHRDMLGVIGAVLLVATVALRRQVSGLFPAQCCLALSLAAQGMLLFGFIPDNAETFGWVTLLMSVIAAALYFLYPDFLHRTVTTLFAIQLSYWWICQDSIFGPSEFTLLTPGLRFLLLDLHFLATLAGILWCFLPSGWHELRRPLGYALVASLAIASVHPFVFGWFMDESSHLAAGAKVVYPWYIQIGPVITAAAFFIVTVWAAGGKPALVRYRPQWSVFVAFLGLFLFLQMSSVLLALTILLLGFALQNRPILGLGLVLFVFFLGHYYYALGLDLMEKACVLVLSGGLLLILRSRLAQLMPKEAA